MAILKSTKLYKRYLRNNVFIYAINNCNIEVNAGECVVICGEKNSGKSTLLRLLGGLERPTSGDLSINHKNVSRFNDDELAIVRRKEVGYLFNNDSFISELTIHENIIMPALLAQKKYDENYYTELTDRLHISRILSRYPKQVSMSQLQCAAYARALINKPSIILMDEPNDYGYHQMDRDILEFLLNIVYEYHRTLIMVTNDPEVSIYVDHIIKLKDGEIIEDRRI